MPKRLPLFFFILSFLFIISGCAVKKTPVFNYAPKEDFSSPRVVLEMIDRDDHFKDSLKAIAHMELNTPRGRYLTKAAVMLKRPSSLRIEVIPVFGPPDLILTVHEDVLKVFLPQKGEFYIGQASANNLEHFFPFSVAGLHMEDITCILLGTRPRIKERPLTLNGTSQGNLYRLDITFEKRKVQSLWVDTENNRLVRVDLFAAGTDPSYNIRFIGHSPAGNSVIPDKITISPEGNDKPVLVIRYSDVQMAEGDNMAPFDLQPPPGIKTTFIN